MSAPAKINLSSKLGSFDDHWHPRVVAGYNGNDVRVSKLKGDFVWHSHADTDELFLVVEGQLKIEFRDGNTRVLDAGDMIVVPRGVEHRPFCDEECQVLVMDKAGEPTTGDVDSELKRDQLEQI